MKHVVDKRLIFVVSAGRSGTWFLARALDAVPGIAAFHEPEPNFAYELRRSQFFSNTRFWKDVKLPAIASNVRENVYLETSHYFGEGFFEPLLELAIVPDIVLLSRPFREIALSYWRRRSIPGKKFDLLCPDDNVYLQLKEWKRLHDYQLCFWRCIEFACRQALYKERVVQLGGLAVDTSLEQIARKEGFGELVNALNLPEPDWSKYSSKVVNATEHSARSAFPDAPLDELEQEVWENTQACRQKCPDDILQGYPDEGAEALRGPIPALLKTISAN